MDPAYENKKIIDLSNEELISLGFLGEDAAPDIQAIIEIVKSHQLNTVTCSIIDGLRRWSRNPTYHDGVSHSPIPRPQHKSDAEIYGIFAPHLISEYERRGWYHGISGDPPELMWRSDYGTTPFPTPPRGARFFNLPLKAAHGVFNTALNAVWDTVAPRILESIKANGLTYSALKTVRFSTTTTNRDGDHVETFGPVVVWIAVRPGTTTAAAVRDATPAILDILTEENITDVTVEWYEASVVRLSAPPLMKADSVYSPTFGLSHPFSTGLGIPIARESDGEQGTISFLFREMKTCNGDPSDRVLALTNKHVVSADPFTHYEFEGANPQHIVVCGEGRFDSAVAEIRYAVMTGVCRTRRDVANLVNSLQQLQSDGDGDNSATLGRVWSDLDRKDEDNVALLKFLAQVETDWQDSEGRRLGVVDWAPEISVRVDDYHYTCDIATVSVDKAKLENFNRNIIDLGNQYDHLKLDELFWGPFQTASRATLRGREIPLNLQLPVRRALPRPLLCPDAEDKNGEPLYIVAKYGNATKLTLGRYSGMEAYIVSEDGLESREVAVYNYSKTSRSFSERGDSGSLIFTGEGDGLAILHSGMPRGSHSHVTYGTPVWWIIEQILAKYPYAEFCGITVGDKNSPQVVAGGS